VRVMRLGGYNLAISSVTDLIESMYKPEAIDLSKCQRLGKQLITKAAETRKTVMAPYSMSKLLNLLDMDEYHSGCIDALSMATVMQFECKNKQVAAWMEAAEFPACEDQTTILSEMIKFYLACGNGFLIKMRNAQGQWMGLERMLPSEVQIVENYDKFGFFRPDYIQVKNNQKKDFAYADIVHIKKSTHRSNAWGLAYPAHNRRGELVGSISLLIKPDWIVNRIIKDANIPPSHELWIMEKTGMMLFDLDENEIGRNLFDDPLYADYASLLSLGREIVRENSGFGEYVFQRQGEEQKVVKKAVWDSISLYGTTWRVVIAEELK